MSDQARRMGGGMAAPQMSGRTVKRDAPASEAAQDDVRVCYLRHGERVGIGMTVLILDEQVPGCAAKLVEDRPDGLGRVRVMGTDDSPCWWRITKLDGGWIIKQPRFTKEERKGHTALRLSPAGATWRLEIDADPAMPLMLNARTSEEAK